MKNKAINIITTVLLVFAVLAVCIGAATLGRDEGKTSHVHSFRTTGTSSTCTEGGIRTEVCTVCKQERSMPDEPLGHTFVDRICACGEVDGLITFSIVQYDGIYDFCAESGMTWREWIDSKYNTSDGAFSIREANGWVDCGLGDASKCALCVRLNGAVVKADDAIIAGHSYYGDDGMSGSN